ncbi:MAG TPA: isocitrate lyase/phosphoenolpyruvate mutase family protein [Gaiellales bacterium]|nr:isocitrate lyase/phosphoenolpyruvate mutase family protein [Gaiellales bacterium]
MSIKEKAIAFRRLHEGPGAFVMPNPWDIGTARVLAGLGYEALATTSGGLASSLGRRDGEGAVSREEALEHSALIAGATDLPVNGDLENGFGHDPESVAETIRGAAAAGLVGCSIEDSTSAPGEPIYPLSQAVERIAAGVEAAAALPFDFTLTARAENYLHGRGDLDDTIARLQAFDKAGADVLYAPGLLDIEDIRTVCAALSKPVNVLALPGGPSVELLSAAGVRRISIGTGFVRTALGAFLRAAKDVREHGTFGCLDGAATSKDLAPFMQGREA